MTLGHGEADRCRVVGGVCGAGKWQGAQVDADGIAIIVGEVAQCFPQERMVAPFRSHGFAVATQLAVQGLRAFHVTGLTCVDHGIGQIHDTLVDVGRYFHRVGSVIRERDFTASALQAREAVLVAFFRHGLVLDLLAQIATVERQRILVAALAHGV